VGGDFLLLDFGEKVFTKASFGERVPTSLPLFSISFHFTWKFHFIQEL
jgi:hypothetical protein